MFPGILYFTICWSTAPCHHSPSTLCFSCASSLLVHYTCKGGSPLRLCTSYPSPGTLFSQPFHDWVLVIQVSTQVSPSQRCLFWSTYASVISLSFPVTIQICLKFFFSIEVTTNQKRDAFCLPTALLCCYYQCLTRVPQVRPSSPIPSLSLTLMANTVLRQSRHMYICLALGGTCFTLCMG